MSERRVLSGRGAAPLHQTLWLRPAALVAAVAELEIASSVRAPLDRWEVSVRRPEIAARPIEPWMFGEEPAAEVVLAPNAAEIGLARVHSAVHGSSGLVEADASQDLTGQVVLLAGALARTALGVADRFRRRGATTLLAPVAGFDPCEVSLHTEHIVIGCVDDLPSSLERCCDAVLADYGRLDLIILCSGAIAPESEVQAPSAPAPVLGREQGRISRVRALFYRLLGWMMQE